MNRFLTIAFLLLLAFQAVTAIDIAAPENNVHTKNTTMSFDYYIAMQAPNNCTLTVGAQTFPDFTVQQGMNAFTLQNLDEGQYNWQIACQNATTVTQTPQQTFTIDITAPTLTMTKPAAQTLELDVALQASDETSTNLTCTLKNDGSTIDEITVPSGVLTEKTYSTTPGAHSLVTTCLDKAGNSVQKTRNYTITQQDYLLITTNKQTYNLQEPVVLTIDAPSDANVTVDICPNQEGFVQCISPLVIQSYPQTITLPQNNQSGEYIVEGTAVTPRNTVVNTTTYTTDNTISLELTTSGRPQLGEEHFLEATAVGAIGTLSYKWTAPNGTIITTTNNKLKIKTKSVGAKKANVTITDSAGNTKSASISYYVENNKEIIITVKTQNGLRVQGATVQIVQTNKEHTTSAQGIVFTPLDFGTQTIYVGKEGFESVYEDVFINENSSTINLTLVPEQGTILIELTKPVDGAIFNPQDEINVRFTVSQVTQSAVCSLFMSQEAFLEQKSSITLTQNGEQGFLIRELEEGNYTYMIECVHGAKIASSGTQTFLVDANAPTSTQKEQTEQEAQVQTAIENSEDPNKEKELLELALERIKTLPSKEQELIEMLEIDTNLRNAKRVAGQLGRDKFDIKYREDLTDAEKESERTRIQTQLDTMMENAITSIEVLDSKTQVAYITRTEIEELLEEHGSVLEIPTGKSAVEALMQAQQKYTMKTNVYRAAIQTGTGKERTISIVGKQFTYGKNKDKETQEADKLVEIIAKDIARSAQDIIVITKQVEVLLEDPILEFPASEYIVYYVEKDLSLQELLNTQTLLIPEKLIIENGITGYSVFGVGKVSANKAIPLFIMLAMLFGVYLAHYFGLIGAAKVLLYEKGPKKQTHYLRVLMNDIHDNLIAKEYDKALMLYKEVKLTYDQLSIPAQNALFEEITMICAELDTAYAQSLIAQMSDALKENKIDFAIECFAKIEGTYERLPQDQQEQMQEIVQGLAQKVGMEASA